jgi:Uma2 family endonuclease
MPTELAEKIQPSTEKEYSFEEVYQLNHNGGRYELVNGKLSEKMVASFNHGEFILDLGGDLRRHAKENNLGAASTDAGFILRREPKLLRSPDIRL